ncbi:hypothetical protein ABKW33_20475, partial [Sanguibacter sp. 26GB23]
MAVVFVSVEDSYLLVGVEHAFTHTPMAYPSGTTIKISLLLGWIREISSRFSFLLANPNSTV